jgi:hypothetical protein
VAPQSSFACEMDEENREGRRAAASNEAGTVVRCCVGSAPRGRIRRVAQGLLWFPDRRYLDRADGYPRGAGGESVLLEHVPRDARRIDRPRRILVPRRSVPRAQGAGRNSPRSVGAVLDLRSRKSMTLRIRRSEYDTPRGEDRSHLRFMHSSSTGHPVSVQTVLVHPEGSIRCQCRSSSPGSRAVP